MLLFRGKESHPRSFVKAISWRALGSVDTFLLSLFFTHSAKAAGAIASTEIFTKILLYFFHERVWAHFSWGLRLDPAPAPPPAPAQADAPVAIADPGAP